MTATGYKDFELGFYDAFHGKDCLKTTKNYVAGYMKGREVAKNTGVPTFKRSSETTDTNARNKRMPA
jgi:hypothetical protein